MNAASWSAWGLVSIRIRLVMANYIELQCAAECESEGAAHLHVCTHMCTCSTQDASRLHKQAARPHAKRRSAGYLSPIASQPRKFSMCLYKNLHYPQRQPPPPREPPPAFPGRVAGLQLAVDQSVIGTWEVGRRLSRCSRGDVRGLLFRELTLVLPGLCLATQRPKRHMPHHAPGMSGCHTNSSQVTVFTVE